MLGKNEGTSTYREDFKDFSGLKMRNVRCHQFDILNINAVDRARGIFDKTVSRFRNTSHRECMEWWYHSSASNHFFLSTLYDHLSSLEDFDIVNVRRTILLRRTQLFYQVFFNMITGVPHQDVLPSSPLTTTFRTSYKGERGAPALSCRYVYCMLLGSSRYSLKWKFEILF